MKTITRTIIPPPVDKAQRKNLKLNIGCGRRFHEDWVNIDLRSQHKQVIECDVTQGLPFSADIFEAVYHSHVLEHLVPDEGKKLVKECFRVLQPGGILRIVIPDLERIARLYLQSHRSAWDGNEAAIARYTWIKLEMLDQMVRQQSGGMMGQYMAALDRQREYFVRSRIGAELDYCRAPKELTTEVATKKNPPTTLSWRERFCRKLIRILLGAKFLTAFNEALFRKDGEIHRWMYDRFSLRQLCADVGFVDFRCCSASESSIENFVEYRLDSENDRVFKPDSLFVECRKPVKNQAANPVSDFRRAV
ncbi:MAG: methyltransferase domain-containing protein [Pirellulaceae bacterium]